MSSGELNILIVAESGPLVAEMAKELLIDMQADISIVDTLEEARALMSAHTYDAILTTASLPDGHGVSLSSEAGRTHAPPVIVLLDAEPATCHVLEMIRMGAADVIPQPLDMNRVIEAVRRLGESYRRDRTRLSRSKRLRTMTSRLVKDRRELRQRVDLICRDLVNAYQRLAEKVVEVRQDSSRADSN